MTQAQALTILKTGANVFLTGEPGAGKTHTINEYIRYLREHGVEPAITASTGIAATHIHGQTIHSWSGIGVRRQLSPYDLDTLAATEYLAKRISKTNVLIIDEISMIDGETLSMVDQVCRAIKTPTEPFGGLQVVVVGDFFQLPPVSRAGTASFAFQSPAWREMKPLVCYLTEQHRQHDDQFLSILDAIRKNEYGETHHEYLAERLIAAAEELTGDKTITRLFSHNADVDALNSTALEQVPGTKETFRMTTKGKASLVESLKKGCLSPETLELKLGAVVMCTKNSKEKGFVNGTLGKVVGFERLTNYPIIETYAGRSITVEPMDWNIEENGKVKASITQIPLRLAWAITIHKSQGMSLDAAVMDLRQVFEYGQGYVALSRVRTLSGLHLLGVNRRTFEVHPEILKVDRDFRTSSEYSEVLFGDMDKEELAAMQRNFLTAIGGTVSPIQKKETPKKAEKGKTTDHTLELVRQKKPLAMIARARSVTVGTILSHLEKLVAAQELQFSDLQYLLDAALVRALPEIEETFEKLDTTLLSPVHHHYKGKYSFDKLRLVRLVSFARKN